MVSVELSRYIRIELALRPRSSSGFSVENVVVLSSWSAIKPAPKTKMHLLIETHTRYNRQFGVPRVPNFYLSTYIYSMRRDRTCNAFNVSIHTYNNK